MGSIAIAKLPGQDGNIERNKLQQAFDRETR